MDDRRILFVSHSAVVSGAEAILIELAKSSPGASAFVFEAGPLQERLSALKLDVITSRHAAGLNGIKRSGSLLRALPLAGRFAAIISEIARAARGHDVIYANSQKAFVLSAIAARLLRRPLVWHLHDIPSRQHFGTAQLKLQITLANACADRVIVPSMAARDGFVEAGGSADLVRIVPNGVPLLPPDLPSRQAVRAELGLGERPVIGIFSRLAPWKGQHVVIEALAGLPNVDCVIAGTALFGEDAYAEELKGLTVRLGVRDRVHFLGQRSDVTALMRAVDIVVHPSTSPEPFGLTLVESALAGTPVIAARAGAVPEILDEGAVGWMVPPGDAAALAAEIRTVLASPIEAGVKATRARARAEIRYSSERMVADVANIIRELPVRASQ